MAFKIYVENNHIVVQDLISDKEFRAASKEALFFKDKVSESTYNTNGFFPEGLQGVKFSDIIDENDAPFSDEQAFIDFFSANTGNFNSGGASSLPTDVQDALLGADSPSTSNPFVTKNNLDEKADKSRTSIILKNNFSPNVLTSNVSVETIVDNYDLGVGFLGIGESLNLYAEVVKNGGASGTASSFFYLSKVPNSISVNDAVKIATSIAISSGGGSNVVQRTFHRKSSSILSGRILGTTASITDVGAALNPQNIINDINLSNYRYLIVTSTYQGTGGGITMQTNVVLTKNPVI